MSEVTTTAQAAKYTRAEVAVHNKIDDCWMVIRDKVYRIDEDFIMFDHPGGSVILSSAGKDGTHLFFQDHWHSEVARQVLVDFCIGQLQEEEAEASAEQLVPTAT